MQCHKVSLPHSVKRLFKVNIANMQFLLFFDVAFNHVNDLKNGEQLVNCASSRPEACLFFWEDEFCSMPNSLLDNVSIFPAWESRLIPL